MANFVFHSSSQAFRALLSNCTLTMRKKARKFDSTTSKLLENCKKGAE
jgi:hypothetical protein